MLKHEKSAALLMKWVSILWPMSSSRYTDGTRGLIPHLAASVGGTQAETMPKRQRTSAADEDHAQEAAAATQPFEEQEVRINASTFCATTGLLQVSLTASRHTAQQLVIKMSLLPSAMEDLAKNVQTRLTGMLMRSVSHKPRVTG